MSDFAPDGSPVALYARLPSLGEPELIQATVPAGAEILELGAGAGRVTHELLALGHAVVAVDNSEEMLSRIEGAETVLADIETLELGRRFRSWCSRATSSTIRTTPSDARSSPPAHGTSCRRDRCSSRASRGTGRRARSGPTTAASASASATSRSTAAACPARWSTSSTDAISSTRSSRGS